MFSPRVLFWAYLPFLVRVGLVLVVFGCLCPGTHVVVVSSSVSLNLWGASLPCVFCSREVIFSSASFVGESLWPPVLFLTINGGPLLPRVRYSFSQLVVAPGVVSTPRVSWYTCWEWIPGWSRKWLEGLSQCLAVSGSDPDFLWKFSLVKYAQKGQYSLVNGYRIISLFKPYVTPKRPSR